VSVFEGLGPQPEARPRLEAALHAPGHAYLLAGPHGSGKRAYAERFAAALLGATVPRLRSGGHPDFFRVEPEGSGILMDQARALRRDLHMRPFEAERRVYLVLDAHLLGDASANALLKSLEEPPAYAVFVLVSDHVERMLPTILSRLELVTFRRYSTAQLTERVGDPVAARSALGNLERAERLAGDPDAAARRRTYLAIARASLRDPAFDPSAAASEIARCASQAGKAASERIEQEGKELADTVDDKREKKALEKRTGERAKRAGRRAELDELREALDTVAWWYRDVLAAAVGAEGVVVHSDLAGEAAEDAQHGAAQELARGLGVVAVTRQSLDMNVQPALAIEALFHELRRASVQTM
jgi:DNA polymerase-3 subunit delta'